MIFFQTIAVAFGMFSAIPVPQFEWNRKNMRYVFLAFPLIGALIGLVLWGWTQAAAFFNLPDLMTGAVCTILPVLITGGIHLDGYADTSDALASHADKERKLQILKDPHIGSFAVIRIACHFVLVFALWCVLPKFQPVAVILSFCLSRVLSGLAVTSFPMAKDTGLAHSFSDVSDKRTVRTILIAADVLLCAGMSITGIAAAAMAVAAHLVFLWYFHMSRRQFGGITGDLAGWFLIQAEKWMLIALVAAEILEGLL